MSNNYKRFTGEEMTALLEIARLSLDDIDQFERISEKTDISESVLFDLKLKLMAYMD